MNNKKAVREVMLGLVPANGDAVSQVRPRHNLAVGHEVDDESFASVRDALIDEGVLAKGRGKAGPLRLAASQPSALRRRASDQEPQVLSYRHGDRRKNNPEVGMVDPDTDPEQPKTTWAYDPHIDPALQFDIGRAQVETLIDDALASGDEQAMRRSWAAQASGPFNWTAKLSAVSVEHRFAPCARRDGSGEHPQRRSGARERREVTAADAADGGYSAPENCHFATRSASTDTRGMVDRRSPATSAGMNSLLQKEGMAAQLQMIYVDPPRYPVWIELSTVQGKRR
jgi:adenine-specific DNA-methyltransferase